MMFVNNHKASTVKKTKTILKYPDGRIVIDGEFLWVYYKGTIILRIKNLQDGHFVNVQPTSMKFGFIDGSAQGDMYANPGWRTPRACGTRVMEGYCNECADWKDCILTVGGQTLCFGCQWYDKIDPKTMREKK